MKITTQSVSQSLQPVNITKSKKEQIKILCLERKETILHNIRNIKIDILSFAEIPCKIK